MLPALLASPECEVVAICGSTPARLSALAGEYQIEQQYGQLEGLLGNADIDAVYVASRSDAHRYQVGIAAAAGKHVLCEKPLALSLQDAVDMVIEARRCGVLLACNHYHRHKASHKLIRSLVSGGAIGSFVTASVQFTVGLRDDQRTWRLMGHGVGGGVFRDLTVHDADVIRNLLQDEVHAVIAHSDLVSSDAKSEDVAAGVFEMRSGRLVSFVESFSVPGGTHGLTVWGSKGCIVGQDVLRPDTDGSVSLVRAGKLELLELDLETDPFQAQVLSFNHAIRTGTRPVVSGEDGLRALAVALAASASARSQTRIPVADVDELLSAS
jgi:1,5-anhydro-D-fructose reductase (1,5-anhydro-D-mannitol-forming)